MDKLIITVTVDSTMSYPRNHFCPEVDDVEAVAKEYIASVKAGASICHIHGVHHLEDEIQPDGRKLSRIDYNGWKKLKDLIKEKVNPIMQYGIASARLPEKIKLLDQKPDMMSYCFTAHDEHFWPDKEYDAVEAYAIHTRQEIEEFCIAAKKAKVKVEVESFHTGAFYNLNYLRSRGLFQNELIWTTLFLGWGGGCWTPPTPKALIYLIDHLPASCNWSVSVMDPSSQWKILTLAIILGGHVRVGWEDNPYVENGRLAESNVELVRKIVEIARMLGRDIATPDEARIIINKNNGEE